ncbi:MAG TPA: ATP-binding protein [Candidatus Acidoferrum sp.]|nr:ATP-binding protein [Candidatus Acidoferrum sp.]
MGTQPDVAHRSDGTTSAFTSSLQHLLAELERIDLLIAAEVARARRLHAGDEQFRGLYISEGEVDALLEQPIGRPRWAGTGPDVLEQGPALDELRRLNGRRREGSVQGGIELRLDRLQQSFGLDAFEIDVLLVCLAVEMDLRYEKLYAYLHDDVTKKRPSVGLVLDLLAPAAEAGFAARRYFSGEGSLFRNHVLTLLDDPAQPHPPLLARSLAVDPRIVRYLLDSDTIDERIRPFSTLLALDGDSKGPDVDEAARRRLVRLVLSGVTAGPVIVHLRGPYGVGKHGMAAAVCREVGMRLLVADAAKPAHDRESGAPVFELVQREAKLLGAAVLWKNFDVLLAEDKRPGLASFVDALGSRPALTFLAGEARWEPHEALRAACLVNLELSKPSWAERLATWSAALEGHRRLDADVDLGALATTFRFTGGQIRDAATMAINLACLRDPEAARLSRADLYEACRFHSNQRLATLARKIVPRYQWDDIVLPGDRVERLREICNHMKYRERVHGEWGFEGKLSLGKGLGVLFSGPSGTGKTMAAEIIASALGLELYKVDLSMVVSKYIGDTEKNLSRIFTEAETSNAILFFDEADALFGKRSDVKDSHDRYANIEVGYLLQRMEEYDGVVILATNLRKNMDEAFVRRLQFTVEFPFPDEEDRRRIWKGVWPDDTPRDPGLDLDFLARRFEIAGGSIRNIALASAFLAAADGNVVTMSHLMHATKREFQKMGKVVTEGEFRE